MRIHSASGMHGFTLVEMSIVLLIIGLIVGGILMGQNIIRQSEVSSTLTDADYYFAGVSTFQQRYQALPGDMPNATDQWGEADANPATCKTTVGTGTATCNGDGNGQIGEVTFGSSTDGSEYFRAWQHLSNAGLVKGNYTGVSGTGGVLHHMVGVNCPAADIQGAGFALAYTPSDGATPSYFPIYAHALHFGKQSNTFIPNRATMTPEEAYNIDFKIDDGKPGTGKVMSHRSDSISIPGCTTGTAAVTAAYSLTSSSVICTLLFVAPF